MKNATTNKIITLSTLAYQCNSCVLWKNQFSILLLYKYWILNLFCTHKNKTANISLPFIRFRHSIFWVGKNRLFELLPLLLDIVLRSSFSRI